MTALRRVMVTALLLMAGWVPAAFAQQATVTNDDTAMVSQAEHDRAYVREVLSRDEVRTAARIGNVDLDRAVDGVSSLDGDRLERATNQARLVDRALGAQDTITLSTTMIIIILLLVIIVIIAV